MVEAGDERAVGGGDYSYHGLPCELTMVTEGTVSVWE